MSNNAQNQNVTKQLREVSDLINSYQQKIALLNEEIELLKQQLNIKDKELDQFRIQLKNLKRSRSNESSLSSRRQLTLTNIAQLSELDSDLLLDDNKNSNSNSSQLTALEKIENLIIYSTNNNSKLSSVTSENVNQQERNKRAASVDSTNNSAKQLEITKDEIRLLRNKISRLEDDLMIVTQVSWKKIYKLKLNFFF